MFKQRIVFIGMMVLFLFAAAAVPAVQASSSLLITPTPTAAPPVTATPAGTTAPATIGGGALAADGLQAWCLAKGTLYSSTQLVDTKPADTKIREMKVENGVPVITTVNDACIFVFTFTGAMPEGVQLQFADMSKAVWLKTDLKAGTKTNTGFAALRHLYIVDPPFWSTTYTAKLVGKDGSELWSSPMIFRRGYEPGKCYDGKWPDPVTWYCYYPPDAHPWDPWYKFENPKP